MNQPKITLVELPPTSFGKLNGERVKDIYTKVSLPARANPLLHAILLQQGYQDVQSIDPNLNGNGSKLTALDLERIVSSDFLLLSAITRTIPQTRELAKLYKKANPRGKVVAGGPHVTFLSEEALEWADFVVRREGDKTLPELLAILEKIGSVEGVEGTSYKSEGKVVHEPDRKLLTAEELSLLPIPIYNLDSKGNDILLTSRGCPYECDFCSVSPFYGGKYRRRSNDSVINELRQKKQRHLFFGDDNFAANKKLTKELLQMIIKEGLNKREYSSQMSINASFNGEDVDEEFLELYKRIGGFGVCIGFESLNPETLRLMKKSATVERNDRAAKAFRKAGIWVHGMEIVGLDTDTKESLDEMLEWSKENLDSVQFLAPIPLPGTPFREQMEREKRILTNEYHLYDGFHIILEPKNSSPYESQKRIIDMHKSFYAVTDLKSIRRSPHPYYKFGIHAYAKKIIHDIEHEPQTTKHFERLRRMG